MPRSFSLLLLLLCSSGQMNRGADCTVLQGKSQCGQQRSLMSVRTGKAEFGDSARGYRRLEVVTGNRPCPEITQLRYRKGRRNRQEVDPHLSFDCRVQGSQLFYYTGLVHSDSLFPTSCGMSDVLLFGLRDAVGTRRTTGRNRCESVLETELLRKEVTGADTLVTYALDQHISDSPHLTRITFDTKFRVKRRLYDNRGLLTRPCEADSLIEYN